ncbi:MAG: hypothetical protein SFW66_02070 [Gammaproteobacteria bacterium]|nr:hypothetical protein [Gammaproteobacteria bacterium]
MSNVENAVYTFLINKSFIDHIVISKNLDSMKIYLDKTSDRYKINKMTLDAVASEYGSMECMDKRDFVERTFLGLQDMEVRLAKIKRDEKDPFYAASFSMPYLKLQERGIEHTIQDIILQLFENGLIDENHLEEMNKLLRDRIPVLRAEKLHEIEVNLSLVSEVVSIRKEFSYLAEEAYYHWVNWSFIIGRTLQVLNEIHYNDGNLPKSGCSLGQLLSNEVETDEILRSLAITNKVTEMLFVASLSKFQEKIKQFVDQHKQVILDTLEPEIKKCSPLVQELYREHKSENPSPYDAVIAANERVGKPAFAALYRERAVGKSSENVNLEKEKTSQNNHVSEMRR